MPDENWEVTCKRFVAFFDILGFKELVLKEGHESILKKLDSLKEIMAKLENHENFTSLKSLQIEKNQTRSVTFSDSIIIFSKGDTYQDAIKIFFDVQKIFDTALNYSIPIKGAISFGYTTVDFSKSIFFGQPIVDAFLLHEELKMLSIILDNNIEKQIRSYLNEKFIKTITTEYKAFLKTGRITHILIRPYGQNEIKKTIDNVSKLYQQVSGQPRIYYDNTLEFLKSMTELPKE